MRVVGGSDRGGGGGGGGGGSMGRAGLHKACEAQNTHLSFLAYQWYGR